MRRWRDKARRAKKGTPGAALEFKSETIPSRLAEYIRSVLEQGDEPFGFLRNLREVKVEPDRHYERELRERILDVFRARLDRILASGSEADALALLEGFATRYAARLSQCSCA